MDRLKLAGLVGVTLVVLVLVGSLLAGLGGEPRPPAPEEVPAVGEVERVRVEVLNAGGLPGRARAVTEHLRELGFDVVYYGNASGFGPDTTRVLDRVGRLEWAERVAEAMGVEHVRTAVDSALFVDVSVIVGRDWPDDAPEAADSAGG